MNGIERITARERQALERKLEQLRTSLAKAEAERDEARANLDVAEREASGARSALATETSNANRYAHERDAALAERDRLREAARIVAGRDVTAAIGFAAGSHYFSVDDDQSRVDLYQVVGSFQEDARYTYPARETLWTAVLEAALEPTAPVVAQSGDSAPSAHGAGPEKEPDHG